MLRLTNKLRNLTVSTELFQNNFTNYQTVRWRKPRWLPTAKSKIFRVPKRPVIPEEERLEILRLFNAYRTKIKSMRRYLTYKHCTLFLASQDPEEQRKIFEEDLIRCTKLNDEWNLKQKEIREKRIAEELEEEYAFARNRLETELMKEEKKVEIIEDLVRKQKEAAKNFILPENIDEAIDHALENYTEYNFAVTLQGEKIVGRENNGIKDEEKLVVKQ